MPILPFKGIWPTIEDDVFIAPGAFIIGNVTIHSGASIWYNTVLRGDSAAILIGHKTNIQDNCTLHVDPDMPLTIGDECTIGHGAVIHGATVSDRVLIGLQAVVLNLSKIGSNTLVGACALISERKQIPSGVLAMGVPAKVLRNLTDDELAHFPISAQEYYTRALEHRRSVTEMREV